MKEEILLIKDARASLRVLRFQVCTTTYGLIEGRTKESILWNIEFQGCPFGNKIPFIMIGLDSDIDLANAFIVWISVESEPLNSEFTHSALNIGYITTDWREEIFLQIEEAVKNSKYWEHCNDLDY